MTKDIEQHLEREANKCKTHGETLEHPECSCDDGWTENDDYGEVEMVTCHRCSGSGLSPWKTCRICDEDAMEAEIEYEKQLSEMLGRG